MRFNIEDYNPTKNGVLDNDIFVKFSKDIDKSTAIRNIVLVEDVNNRIEDIDTFFKEKKEPVAIDVAIEGLYANIHVRQHLNKNKKYILFVSSGVRSIDGHNLESDLLIPFFSKKDDKYINIKYPSSNSIVEDISRIEFVCDDSVDIVRVQVSDTSAFTRLILNDAYNSNTKTYIPTVPINKEGSYCIRVGTGGVWSDICNVYVSPYVKNIESSDIDSAFIEEDSLDKPLEIKLTPSNIDRIYTSYSRLLLTVNNISNIDEFLDSITITKIYDYDNDVSCDDNVKIKSLSYIVCDDITYVIIDITSEEN